MLLFIVIFSLRNQEIQTLAFLEKRGAPADDWK
jgi:hypothetical protein